MDAVGNKKTRCGCVTTTCPTSQLSFHVPIGAAVCSHDSSDPKRVLNVMERQTIYHRNHSLAHLPAQGDGGPG